MKKELDVATKAFDVMISKPFLEEMINLVYESIEDRGLVDDNTKGYMKISEFNVLVDLLF